MEEAFGTIPLQFKVFPEHLRPAAWELLKAQQSQEAVIPAKYAELIGLAVASQIPCDHCVYYHSEMAKILGATDAEIQEAVSTAADTRFWSTVLNGSNIDFDVTKAEVDKMLMHVKKQTQSTQAH
ncbi:MAG TPA: carboxymuconolactone decarboxylase family protein [Bacteroides sp.]|nr:carboxymuconolactone decarboxylase family protein [Bacteroides sp.]